VSAPRASDIASRTGIAQSVIHSKAPKVDNKKAEEARLRTLGDEEDEGNQGAKGAKGGGKAGGPGASQFGQEDRQKVKRKRVRLSELSGKKTSATAKKPEAQAKEAAAEAKAPGNPEEVGRKVAQAKLNEQGKLAETRFLYQQKVSAQAQQDPNSSLSAQGTKLKMLNNLIRYQECNYMQHTGDKAGEIYNRPATRQILQALQGLKTGSTSGTAKSESSTSTSTAGLSPGAHKAKTEKANKMLEMFMLADKKPPEGYEPTELVA